MARRDPEEFTSFVLKSQPGLRRTAYLMCGDWQLASDHVQEALIRVWVDATGTQVFVEDLETGDQHQVPVPLDDGCRLPPVKSYFQELEKQVQTNGSLVAVAEMCGHGADASAHIVVSDLSGRLVTEVDPARAAVLWLRSSATAHSRSRGPSRSSGTPTT